MKPLRIAIVGFGKIAADQHVPAIGGVPRFTLAATVSRQGNGVAGVPVFASHGDMLRAVPDLDAVAITTPPSARYAIARDCIEAGLHVLLEKPPAVTLGEIEDLASLAEARGTTLFTTWHAQYGAAVPAAAAALAGQRIAAMEIVWREDVRKWHPGQQWIWEAGGFGVFDPGINALSIAAHIFPGPLFVRTAELFVPANKQAPIAARLSLFGPDAETDIPVTFDWRHEGGEAWTITARTANGTCVALTEGGARLAIDDLPRETTSTGEYPALYRRFLNLIDARASDVDTRPLRLVADAFLVGRRTAVEAFED